MAIPQTLLTLSLTILLSFSLIHCHVIDEHDGIDLIELEPKPTKQKLSHFSLYWHDIVSGTTPSSIPIVNKVTKRGFGQVNIIDNPLTVGPEMSSKVVGKAQGIYASSCQEDLCVLMAMNFFFTTGKYNGSTITILGRNAIFDDVREMPVIGGSGLFRFARGYAEARTHVFDLKTGDATVEYTIHVLHF